ncbi:ferritin-like domain-containing protein [Salinimicrobium flavum]|uniref:PA2169 family four-helix-bundle protein n=1 Tax=Salinimicrobium flavum TaxID=1737065 RepID=A0ABW5ITR3_9FLAO
MRPTKEMAEKLNELLEKNYDSEKGFLTAADAVKNERLISFFKEKAQQRYNFGHELKAEIRTFGEEPEKGSSMKSGIHRAWMDLKSALNTDREEAVLEEVIKGEKAAVAEYNEIIRDDGFPPSTSNLLIKQRNAIETTLKEVKDLEDIYD